MLTNQAIQEVEALLRERHRELARQVRKRPPTTAFGLPVAEMVALMSPCAKLPAPRRHMPRMLLCHLCVMDMV